MFIRAIASAILLLGAVAGSRQSWQGQNLQYFPKDIGRPDLIANMRTFSMALGVRCQHCHSGGDGVSLDGVDFAADDKPAKLKARAMLRMVDELNSSLLAAIPSRAEPRVEISCVTCHRGLPLPKTLEITLFETITRDGAGAGVARYRELREAFAYTGEYDFGEWELDDLARRLRRAGDLPAAVAVLELSREFHPASASVDLHLGDLYFQQGNRAEALAAYRRVLDKVPGHQLAVQRIAELEKRD